MARDVEAIAGRLVEYSCRVIGLFDAPTAPFAGVAVARIDSGLPEELTPLTLVVLGQLLANQVAIERGIDPDAPRALRKVTRTW